MESSAKSKYDAFTVGMNKRYAQNYQFQWNYTIGRDMSDDDNERDPFTFRYARADNLAPEYNYSDRDQRHRFNAWLLVTAKGFDFNTRISSRTAQPRSVGDTPQARILPTARSSSATRCARTTSSSRGTSASGARSI